MSITGVSQTSTQLPSNTTFQQRNDAFNSLDQALSGGDLSSAQSAFATLQSLGPKDGKGPPPGDGNDPMAKDMAAVSSALQSGDLSGAQTAFAKLKSDMAAHRGHHHKPQDADGDFDHGLDDLHLRGHRHLQRSRHHGLKPGGTPGAGVPSPRRNGSTRRAPSPIPAAQRGGPMAKTDDITIFHNPNCSTSRKALQMIRDAGHTPTVVEYLKTGWTKAQLKDLLARMGAGPRDILRVRGTPAEDLGLTAPGAAADAILDAMVEHPVLVERPIVAGAKGVALGRPLEKIEPLL